MAQENQGSIEQFEIRLSHVLTPVRPDPGFINRLERRLTNRNRISIERRRKGYALVVLGLGLFIGSLIVWIIYAFQDKKD